MHEESVPQAMDSNIELNAEAFRIGQKALFLLQFSIVEVTDEVREVEGVLYKIGQSFEIHISKLFIQHYFYRLFVIFENELN